MARTDTIEYFKNIALGIQTAPANEVAAEALRTIDELQQELLALHGEKPVTHQT